eukprot:11319450-Alexandrium_andersonii.AAC.1
MSASLVGSEMCIRDRPRNREIAGSNLQSANPHSAQSFAIGAGEPRNKRSCLLYTSDAADDM